MHRPHEDCRLEEESGEETWRETTQKGTVYFTRRKIDQESVKLDLLEAG